MSSIEFADGKPLTDEEIRSMAADRLSSNRRYIDDDLRRNMEYAYRYYKGDPRVIPAAEGCSKAVSTDVPDAVEWVLPAILKPLVESPDAIRFDPVNPEDEEQAALESDYVHHVLMKQCNGFETLYTAVKDALLLKNSVVSVHWSEGTKSQPEEYKGLTQEEVDLLLTPTDDSEVRLVEQTGPYQSTVVNQTTGEPVLLQVFDVEIRRFWTKGYPEVENCVPERFRVEYTHDRVNLETARSCSYSLTKSRGQLVALGYDPDIVRDLPVAGREVFDNEVRWEREDVEREYNQLNSGTKENQDPSQDEIDVHRVFMCADADGDGHEELLLVVLAGRDGETKLDHYEVPCNPFCAGTPFIQGHKFYGLSLFDKLRSLADQKTAVLRAWQDNLWFQNNPELKVLRGQATLEDVLIRRPGGMKRMDTIGAVEPMITPQITQQSMALLEYYDKQRGERVGVDPDAQSVSSMMPEESMNHAMERLFSAKEAVIDLIIRTFAETQVKQIVLKLRGEILRHMNHSQVVKLRNKWVTVDPSEWVTRDDTTVKIGLGTGDRMKKTQGLMTVLADQTQLMQQGMLGTLVTPERMLYTRAELIRVQGLGDPDDYYIDPKVMTEPNAQFDPRAQEAWRADQMRQKMQQEAQQAEAQKAQAAAQAQQQQGELLKQLEMIRAEGKETTEKIKQMSETMRFLQKERREWAELAADTGAADADRAADVATELIKEGNKQLGGGES